MADWYVSSVAWNAIPQYAASTAYTIGQIIRPLTAPAFGAQYAFRCTTGGTPTSEPNFTTAAANNATTTASGGAVFTNVAGQSAYGWAAAAGNFYSMSAQGSSPRIAIGDRVFLSSDHSESSASATYSTVGVAGFGLVQVISVNRAGSVPPVPADEQSGAAITVTVTFTLTNYVNNYWQGITFTLASAGSTIGLSSGGQKRSYFKNCAFVFTTSNTIATITCNNPGSAVFDATTVNFNAAGQRFVFSITGFEFIWLNTPAPLPGTIPTILFPIATQINLMTFRAVDLSALTTTLFVAAANSNSMKMLLDSCRIAPGLVRAGTANYASSGDEIELVNCYDGTSIFSERHTPAGDLTTDTAVTMTGGASDNVGGFSHKLISSVRNDFIVMPLDSFWLDINNTGIGAAHTATVELISNATLNNNDVTMLLEYEGTSGSSLASIGNSLVSPLAATAPLTTSPVSWTNTGNVGVSPTPQRLQVTFTPQQAGRLRALVRLGRPSTTLWINPQITVT